jgi:hypothetical protein
MTDTVAAKGPLGQFGRAPCLGCGRTVVAARDAHCLIGGTRDGSLLIVVDVAPQRSFATDLDLPYADVDLFLLGAAHRDCVPEARRRLEAQEVELPQELSELVVDENTGELPAMHLPPVEQLCAFCGATDATEEHVFPTWVSRELNQLAPLVVNTEHGTRRVRSVELRSRSAKSATHGGCLS